MAGGRPIEYSKELLALANAYLNVLPEDEVVHSIEGLSVYMGVARSTIYNWIGQEDKEEFLDIVNKILAKQGKTLINKGLNNETNASITKVMLTKHGYREGIDTTTNGKDIEKENTQEIKDLAKRLNDLEKNI